MRPPSTSKRDASGKRFNLKSPSLPSDDSAAASPMRFASWLNSWATYLSSLFSSICFETTYSIILVFAISLSSIFKGTGGFTRSTAYIFVPRWVYVVPSSLFVNKLAFQYCECSKLMTLSLFGSLNLIVPGLSPKTTPSPAKFMYKVPSRA